MRHNTEHCVQNTQSPLANTTRPSGNALVGRRIARHEAAESTRATAGAVPCSLQFSWCGR